MAYQHSAAERVALAETIVRQARRNGRGIDFEDLPDVDFAISELSRILRDLNAITKRMSG